MIKSFKTGAIVFIILSVLLFLGGMGFSKLAEENRGVEVKSGYAKDGKFIATDVGVIGANKEGEEAAESMAVVCNLFGGVCALAGVIFAIAAAKKKSTKTTYKNGVILEKSVNGTFSIALVEFDDNTRKKLVIEPPLIVAQGDRGRLGYKGNALVEFTKQETATV